MPGERVSFNTPPKPWLVQYPTSFGQGKSPIKTRQIGMVGTALRAGRKNQMHHGGFGETALAWPRPEIFGIPGNISELLAKDKFFWRLIGTFDERRELLAKEDFFWRKIISFGGCSELLAKDIIFCEKISSFVRNNYLLAIFPKKSFKTPIKCRIGCF